MNISDYSNIETAATVILWLVVLLLLRELGVLKELARLLAK